MLNKKSVTLVEVMVSMVIMATCVAGLYATFIAGKKATTRSKHKLIALNYARQVAEALKSEVSQDTYETGNLGCNGSYPCDKNPVGALSLPLPPGLNYTSPNPANYRIENLTVASTNMRKVTITLTWDEPNP